MKDGELLGTFEISVGYVEGDSEGEILGIAVGVPDGDSLSIVGGIVRTIGIIVGISDGILLCVETIVGILLGV